MAEYKNKKWIWIFFALLISFSSLSQSTYAFFGLDDGIALGVGCIFGAITSGVSHQCLSYRTQASLGNLCEECNYANPLNPFGGCTEYKCRAIGSNCRFQNNPNGEGGTCTDVASVGAPQITEFEFGSITKNKVINANRDGNNWNINVLNRNEAYYIAFITDILAICRRASNPSTFSSSGGQELKLTNGLVHADGTGFHILDDSDFNQQYPLCPENGDSLCRDYIRCSSDDRHSPVYSVSFKLRDVPDEQAPQILQAEPENGLMFSLSDTNFNFRIGVADPAGINECRYSTTLRSYNQMTEKLNCVPANFNTEDTIVIDDSIEQNFVMECGKNFPILPTIKDYDIYVSCKDSIGNFHETAERFSYRGAEPLNLKIKIDNADYDTAVDGEKKLTGARHDLVAQTFGGDNDKSLCEYSYALENGQQSELVLFETIPLGASREVYENIAIRPVHNLRLDNLLIYSGRYHFRINCFDPVGNDLTSEVLLDVSIPGRRFDDLASTLTFIETRPNGRIETLNPVLEVKLGGGERGQGEGAVCKWTTDANKAYGVTLDRNKFNELEGTFLDGVTVDHGNGFAHQYSSAVGTLEDKKSYTYRVFCKDINGAIKGPQNIRLNIDIPDTGITPPEQPGQCQLRLLWTDLNGRVINNEIEDGTRVVAVLQDVSCRSSGVSLESSDLRLGLFEVDERGVLGSGEDDVTQNLNFPDRIRFESNKNAVFVEWTARWMQDSGADGPNLKYVFRILDSQLISDQLVSNQLRVKPGTSQPPPEPPEPPEPPITPAGCSISSIKWVNQEGREISVIGEGAKAIAIINGQNCSSQEIIDYKVMEKDSLVGVDELAPDDVIVPDTDAEFEVDNVMYIEWTATIQENDFNPNNEYYIQIGNRKSKTIKVVLSACLPERNNCPTYDCGEGFDQGICSTNGGLYILKNRYLAGRCELQGENYNCIPRTRSECFASENILDGIGPEYQNITNCCTNANTCDTVNHIYCDAYNLEVPDATGYCSRCSSRDSAYCSGVTILPPVQPPEDHKACGLNQNCLTLVGEGVDTCSNNNQCITIDPPPFGSVHSECTTNGQCVQVRGAGQNLCNSNNDCTNPPPPPIITPSSLVFGEFGPSGSVQSISPEIFLSLRNGHDGNGIATCYYREGFIPQIEEGFDANDFDGAMESTRIFGGTTRYSKTLNNLNIGNHEYYIRCQDSNGALTALKKISFNIVIPATQQLSILSSNPKGNYGKRTVELEATTKGGVGNVQCVFSGIGASQLIGNPKIDLGSTILLHKATANADHDGNYIVRVECNDNSQQTAQQEFSINIIEDRISPDIRQIISTGNSKYITLSEEAECEIAAGDVLPLDENSWKKVGREKENKAKQLITVGGSYYLRCSDIWDNQMNIVRINP